MKKFSSVTIIGFLLFGILGPLSAFAAGTLQCGAGKWKSVFEVNVTTYSQQARVVRGSVNDLVAAHEKGCDMRVKYTYQYTDDNGFARKGNRMYTCSVTAVQEVQAGTMHVDCYSPLWFGAAESGGLKMWSEVVGFGQLDEFPNEANVGVTLYEANKDVQGVTEFFPSTARGKVTVFVRK